MYRAFLFLCFLLSATFTYAAESLNEKVALQLIAQHLDEKVPVLEDTIRNNPSKYLSKAVQLFASIELQTKDMFPYDLLNLGIYGNMTITSGDTRIVAHGNGSLSINGVKQARTVTSVAELEQALTQKHWFTIRNCLTDIAVTAQQILVFSGDEQLIEKAKVHATHTLVPQVLVSKLLGVLAQLNDEGVNAWLLRYRDFKGRDAFVQKMIDNRLQEDNPAGAALLIKQQLADGCGAQLQASKKVFLHYFAKSDLADAESILKNHFVKGCSSYNELAEIIFRYHLKQEDMRKAERCLQKHFTQGYSVSNKLVKEMVAVLLEKHDFDEAHAIVNRNMTQGYTAHRELEKQIDSQEIAYLRSLVRR